MKILIQSRNNKAEHTTYYTTLKDVNDLIKRSTSIAFEIHLPTVKLLFRLGPESSVFGINKQLFKAHTPI